MSSSLPVIPGAGAFCVGSPELGNTRGANGQAVDCVFICDVERIESRWCGSRKVDGNASRVKDHACRVGDRPVPAGIVLASGRLCYGWLRVRRRIPNATEPECD